MSNIKKNVSKNVFVFFDGYVHDFSSIYKEDTKKRQSFDKLMDRFCGSSIRSVSFNWSNSNS